MNQANFLIRTITRKFLLLDTFVIWLICDIEYYWISALSKANSSFRAWKRELLNYVVLRDFKRTTLRVSLAARSIKKKNNKEYNTEGDKNITGRVSFTVLINALFTITSRHELCLHE
jgi:hypothetical protein